MHTSAPKTKNGSANENAKLYPYGRSFLPGYAKRTIERALPATRKRHAHRLANETRTVFQNDAPTGLQNQPIKPTAVDV